MSCWVFQGKIYSLAKLSLQYVNIILLCIHYVYLLHCTFTHLVGYRHTWLAQYKYCVGNNDNNYHPWNYKDCIATLLHRAGYPVTGVVYCCTSLIGPGRLCWHNFEQNRWCRASKIMLAKISSKWARWVNFLISLFSTGEWRLDINTVSYQILRNFYFSHLGLKCNHPIDCCYLH